MTEDTAPERIWAVTEPDDVSAQILGEVYAQQTPEGMVGKPVEYVRKDLFDAARKVKDLVWHSDQGNCQQYANSLIGEIRVTAFGECWFYKGECFGPRESGGLALAKAAAQADYERRILSALDQGGAE